MPLSDVPPSVPPEIAAFAWMLGARDTPDAATPTREFWTAAGDVLWGVGFRSAGGGTRYEILRIDRGEGGVRLIAQHDGGSPTVFPLVSSDGRSATFENPAHDDIQRIRYERKGRGLVASLGLIEDPGTLVWRYRPAPTERAEALEAADRAFAVDVAARGVDAWIDAFDPGGHQWDDDNDVLLPVGPALRDHIAGTLSGKLVWEPVASGLALEGDLGFTVGTWVWTRGDQRGEGSYVTVWKKQSDGNWKVWFDAGDPSGPATSP